MGGRNPVVTARGSSKDAGRIYTRASFESWLDFQGFRLSCGCSFGRWDWLLPDANACMYSTACGLVRGLRTPGDKGRPVAAEEVDGRGGGEREGLWLERGRWMRRRDQIIESLSVCFDL